MVAVVLTAAAGCSRSSDGTILYENPVNRMLGTTEPVHPGRVAAASAFPPAPAPVRDSRRGRATLQGWAVRPVRPPIVDRPSGAGTLSCRNVAAAGARVKVVCD